MRKILLTGAGGTLGNHLLKRLVSDGSTFVFAADRINIDVCGYHNIIGMSNEELLSCRLRDIDDVVNCAFSRGNDTDGLVSSLDFSERLIHALNRIQPKSVINISSQSIYKKHNYGEFVNENDAVEPCGSYAFAKFAQEKMFSSGLSCDLTQIRMVSLMSNGRFYLLLLTRYCTANQ